VNLNMKTSSCRTGWGGEQDTCPPFFVEKHTKIGAIGRFSCRGFATMAASLTPVLTVLCPLLQPGYRRFGRRGLYTK
jgi:hypothetical protein